MSENMAWLDIETTGLEPESDLILEVGIVITTPNLRIVAEKSLVIFPNLISLRDALANNEFVRDMHTNSGLLKEIMKGIDIGSAEQELVEFTRAQIPYKKVPLTGSTISFDRSFLRLQMPELNSYFHYRSIDVSSIRELAKLWYPDHPDLPKSEAHRSIEDIYASIKLLKYYRDTVFIDPVLRRLLPDCE